MKQRKLWMVYNDGPAGEKPTRKHRSLAKAIQEAQRLAEKFPKTRFLIVEIVGGCQFGKRAGMKMVEAE